MKEDKKYFINIFGFLFFFSVIPKLFVNKGMKTEFGYLYVEDKAFRYHIRVQVRSYKF